MGTNEDIEYYEYTITVQKNKKPHKYFHVSRHSASNRALREFIQKMSLDDDHSHMKIQGVSLSTTE